MKWPFVRRSFHDSLIYKLVEREVRLDTEINRLNQELSIEMNNRRETEEQLDFERDYAKKVEKELEKTKRYNENILNEAKIQYEILESSQQLNCDLKKELQETKNALKISNEENEKIKNLNDKW